MEELLPGEIVFNIDVMLAKRKMSVTELSEKVGITIANISGCYVAYGGVG